MNGITYTVEQRAHIENWSTSLKYVYRAHYKTATSLERKNLWLGIPSVILAAVVGTSVFATLNENPTKEAQIAVGLVSVLVAILAALQTFLRLGERAAKHKDAGARFAALSKEVETILVMSPLSEDALREWLEDFQKRWNTLSLEAPTANPRIYERERKRLKHESA